MAYRIVVPAITTSLFLLSSCNIDIEIGAESTVAGVWRSEGYGQIMEIQKNESTYTVSRYHISENYCLLAERDTSYTLEKLKAITFLSHDKKQLTYFDKDQKITPGIVLSRLKNMPDHCTTLILKTIHDTGYKRNPELDFELFWQTFEQFYVNFNQMEINWNQMYKDNKPKINANTTDKELFGILSAMISPLRDGHVNLFSNTETFNVKNKPNLEEVLTEEYLQQHQLVPPLTPQQQNNVDAYIAISNEQINLTVTSYAARADAIKIRANNKLSWFLTENNIGYLAIESMYGFGSNKDFDLANDIPALNKALDEFMEDMRNAKGIILDVRFNPGGYDENAMIIASRFVAHRRHVYSKQARDGNGRTPLKHVYIEPKGKQQYSGPVVVLTSATTFSAGEVFSLAMSSLPNVTIMGEATGGAFSDLLFKRLTNQIQFTLSNEIYLSSAGEWYEGEGVPVDIFVPFLTKQERDTFRDYGIEKSEAYLLKNKLIENIPALAFE